MALEKKYTPTGSPAWVAPVMLASKVSSSMMRPLSYWRQPTRTMAKSTPLWATWVQSISPFWELTWMPTVDSPAL